MKKSLVKRVAAPLLACTLVFSTLPAVVPFSDAQQVYAAVSVYQSQMNTFASKWLAFYDKMDVHYATLEKLMDYDQSEAQMKKMLAEFEQFEASMGKTVSGMNASIQSIHQKMVNSFDLELEAVFLYELYLYDAYTDAEYAELQNESESIYLQNEKALVKELRAYSQKHVVSYSKDFQSLFDETLTMKQAITYKVVRGDTLASVASKYGTSVTAIKNLNGLKHNGLKVGQTLKVYASATSQYTAKKGDTLSAIAKKYGMTLNQLKLLNGFTSNSLKIGQKVKVYVPKAVAPTRYTVQKGDTLYSIASKHNTTVTQLKKLNNLNSNSLKVGQTLKLK